MNIAMALHPKIINIEVMMKQIPLMILITLSACCKEKPEPTPEQEMPMSRIFLSVDDEVVYDISYSACNKAPGASEAIGIDPVLFLFSPGIIYDKKQINVPNDLDMHFVFHDVPIQYFSGPTKDEFWSYLQQSAYDFNAPPYKWDFFLQLRKGDKLYQNWRDGIPVVTVDTISRDETGLAFADYEWSRYDTFGDICYYNLSVLRLKGEITGMLVTKDDQDSIHVKGELDIFMHFRE